MSDFMKQRESLRCLFASDASISVIDWLLSDDHLGNITRDAEDIENKLVNIRSFFSMGMFSRKDIMHRFSPFGSPLVNHIYQVLFSDAVRWWAAAHRTGQDRNKYLQDAMYKGKFVDLYRHFYHDFRNNQLAHFPGGTKSNDIPFLTPIPYGLGLTQGEYDDFRSLLAHSIKLTLGGVDESGPHRNEINRLLNELPEDQRKAAVEVMHKMSRDFDEEILKIPTKEYFPDGGL